MQVTTTNMNGVSPLWIACQDGHLPVVEYCAALAPELLEQPKASGATPFCIACHQGMQNKSPLPTWNSMHYILI
jgi:hypothetical protein